MFSVYEGQANPTGPLVSGGDEWVERFASQWEAHETEITRLAEAAGIQVWWCDSGEVVTALPHTGNKYKVVPLSLPHAEGQTLTMGFHSKDTAVAEVIAELAASRASAFRATLRNDELARDQALLLEELRVNWKSIETLSEISSSLKDGGNTIQLAASLFSRASQLQEGLHLGVWMLSGGSLEPLVLPGTEPFFPDPQWAALVNDVIDKNKPFVVNGRMRIHARQFESPLKGTSHIAVVPIRSADGTQGAMAFWRNEAGRNFDHHLVRMMQAVAVQAAIVLENEHLHRVRIESEKLQHELAIGADIQQLLLVSPPSSDLRGMSAAVLSVPSGRVDGDFYDFIPQGDNSLALLIGDVMGKGVQAALVGAATKIGFLKEMGLLATRRSGGELPAAHHIVAGVARNITRQLTQLGTFVCVCYAHFDRVLNRLQFVNCGYPRILHYSASINRCDVLDNGYLPLGIEASEEYETCTVAYEPGDVFLLCSDGLTDARNARGETFGEHRVQECLHRFAKLPPADLLKSIREEVMKFSEDQIFDDDFTCVAIRIEQGGPAARTACSIWRPECDELPPLREWISSTLTRFDVVEDEDTIWAIQLSITEAFSNIARHAPPDDGAVQMEVSLLDSTLEVHMRYRGNPFDAPRIPEPPFDPACEGGFGLYLMSTLMDEVVHCQIAEGMNQITLRKVLRTESKEL